MIIKKSLLFLGFLLTFYSPEGDANNRVSKLIQKEIKTAYGVASYEQKALQLPDSVNANLKRPLNSENFFELKNEDTLIGYYYLGKAYGKAAYFDFMVLTDKDLILKKVKVLVYREDHGGEIGSKRWLRQFVGKTAEQSVVFGKDIAAISGATISAKALTYEVNEFLRSLRSFNKIRANHGS